ncbi:MAG: amino acid ABC transporter substrate-binding protein [Selenomonadaceae bacterium]|nr:amino acid ABC transporter substrate-binding protein [Selenomonadaceae bacterium]
MSKIFLPLLLMIFLVTGCGNSEDKNKIIIGVDDEYAPICFHGERGELVGFDVDLAKEAAKRMGVKIEFKPIDWNSKGKELQSGNIDMIWNGLDITPERQQYILYSKPYMTNRQILLVRKGNPQNINSLGDLANKIVATQTDSNSEIYIEENENLRNSFADFITYRNIKEEFKALDSGEVDVLVIDEIAARYAIIRNPDTFEIIEDTVGPGTEIGIGFRKDNVELRDKVQKVFDEMIWDGTTKKISEKWFQADLVKSKK